MSTRTNFIIAIDGPSASGKSTLSLSIAKAMNFQHLNTGMLYRFIASEILSSQKTLEQTLRDQELKNRIDTFLKNERDIITAHLETEEVAKTASLISSITELRSFLLPIQRNFAYSSLRGAVLDGRDIASVVIPDADLKIFITANASTRAKRRFYDLQNKKMYRTILRSILYRDIRDLNRKISPLKRIENAFFLDSSELTQEETFLRIIKKIKTFL